MYNHQSPSILKKNLDNLICFIPSFSALDDVR